MTPPCVVCQRRMVKVIVKGIVYCRRLRSFRSVGFVSELERWTLKICERQNAIVCVFDLRSPRISAYEIHDWIYDQICLNDQELTMVQIDGSKRHVYINFRDNGRMQDVLHSTGGHVE